VETNEFVNGFSKVQDDLISLGDKLQQFSKDVGDQLSKEISDTEDQIAKLKEDLKKCVLYDVSL
jgi:archaellum component FlaC